MSQNNRTSGRSKFERFKKPIYILSLVLAIFPKKLRKSLLNLCRNVNGTKGILMRYLLLRTLVAYCGDNVAVYPGVYFFYLENLKIGTNVSIHPMCYIDAEGEIQIGNDVSIAHNTTILSSDHTWKDESLPIKYNQLVLKSTKICDDVWIGGGVRILAGVCINSRSIVGAGCVVKHDVLSRTIVAGIPNKVIKKI